MIVAITTIISPLSCKANGFSVCHDTNARYYIFYEIVKCKSDLFVFFDAVQKLKFVIYNVSLCVDTTL